MAAELPEPCSASIAAVEARVADILRPAGALARLDELAVWLAGWQRTATPTVERPVAVVFAGDHGVAADGVSAYPTEVTGAMLAAFNQDRASISAMARSVGAQVRAVDVGVGLPTGNIRHEPAMDQERFDRCFEAGRAAVRELDTDLLIVGEMGIGNTTAAAAVCSALLSRPATDMVGSGTGIDPETRLTKVHAVDQAVARWASLNDKTHHPENNLALDPMAALRELGGTELVAMAGAAYQAREQSCPLLLDGYVASAALLALNRLDPELTANVRAGHCSAEPGHGLVLDALGLQPLLRLDFRLGEASGAMAALPLVRMACALVNEVPTFTEWFEGDSDSQSPQPPQ
ncbi:MAG: nicotinate-nucleotide--dimethylbenzimidazole phosphoribosyltransferase [Acidimicrobiales bacterium]